MKGGIFMPQFKDLTGKQFGDFTVVEMLHNYKDTKRVYCRCIGIDNNEYIIRSYNLTSGSTKYIKGACRAGQAEDISERKFGNLTALFPTEKRASNSGIIWHCKCDCGNFIDVPVNSLKRGHTTSCGCNKRSQKEREIVKLLDFMNIKYETEKSYEDLFNPEGTQHLYYDFYFPDYNTILEYDGELHFVAYKHFGGEAKLKQIQACDALKDAYCREHGITLIRLNYKMKQKEIIEVIKSIIQPVTITA